MRSIPRPSRPLLAGAALVSLALAACVPSPPQPAPAPTPSPAPAPVPPAAPPRPSTPVPSSTNWMTAPLTPGDWTYRNGLASFGENPANPRLTMRCEGNGRIAINYFGAASAAAAMTIRAEAMEQAVSDVSRSSNALVARLPARDPLLDAMAFSKGRFAVEVAGGPTLYVPSYPEVTRVIEDCR